MPCYPNKRGQESVFEERPGNTYGLLANLLFHLHVSQPAVEVIHVSNHV